MGFWGDRFPSKRKRTHNTLIRDVLIKLNCIQYNFTQYISPAMSSSLVDIKFLVLY